MSTLLTLLWLAAVDGGVPPVPPPPPPPPLVPTKAPLSADDEEMLKHLDLLESLDEARDLEMLQELSVER